MTKLPTNLLADKIPTLAEVAIIDLPAPPKPKRARKVDERSAWWRTHRRLLTRLPYAVREQDYDHALMAVGVELFALRRNEHAVRARAVTALVCKRLCELAAGLASTSADGNVDAPDWGEKTAEAATSFARIVTVIDLARRALQTADDMLLGDACNAWIDDIGAQLSADQAKAEGEAAQ